MGISGLLPFIKNATRPVKMKEFSGCAVAIDVYCWLHRGAFGCAEQLVQGRPTDAYIKYIMKYVNMLLYFNIKPILVFDGRNLPSKAETEKKRRQNRRENREKAIKLLSEGRSREARDYFQRCIDITPEMAREVIQACRERNVDCIVAPYEADAQLAFLNRSGIAQLVITEDSDLTLFGCDKIIFKLTESGDGVLYEKSRLNEVFGPKASHFSFDKYVKMCIMSGCDYLPSLPGIGLAKARNFWSKITNPDLNSVLPKIPAYLNLSVQVTPNYIVEFQQAVNTFLYQLVFDPISKELRPLTNYQDSRDGDDFPYCGEYLNKNIALQMALGNLDLNSLQQVGWFKPGQTSNVLTSTKYGSKTNHQSMWSDKYDPKHHEKTGSIQLIDNSSAGPSTHSNSTSTSTSTSAFFVKSDTGSTKKKDQWAKASTPVHFLTSKGKTDKTCEKKDAWKKQTVLDHDTVEALLTAKDDDRSENEDNMKRRLSCSDIDDSRDEPKSLSKRRRLDSDTEASGKEPLRVLGDAKLEATKQPVIRHRLQPVSHHIKFSTECDSGKISVKDSGAKTLKMAPNPTVGSRYFNSKQEKVDKSASLSSEQVPNAKKITNITTTGATVGDWLEELEKPTSAFGKFIYRIDEKIKKPATDVQSEQPLKDLSNSPDGMPARLEAVNGSQNSQQLAEFALQRNPFALRTKSSDDKGNMENSHEDDVEIEVWPSVCSDEGSAPSSQPAPVRPASLSSFSFEKSKSQESSRKSTPVTSNRSNFLGPARVSGLVKPAKKPAKSPQQPTILAMFAKANKRAEI